MLAARTFNQDTIKSKVLAAHVSSGNCVFDGRIEIHFIIRSVLFIIRSILLLLFVFIYLLRPEVELSLLAIIVSI